MLGASSDIFCSTACLKESCLKTVPTEVFLTRTTCSRVSPGLDLHGKAVPPAPQESSICCHQEEERRESHGQAALLLVKGYGKLHQTLLGYGERQRRSGEGAGATCLPQQGAPHLATTQKSVGKAGPEPRGAEETETSLASMLLSSMTGCPPFPQGIKHASPKTRIFSHPPMSLSGSESPQAANKLRPAPFLPRLVPEQPAPRPPLLQQQGLGSTWRGLKNVKVAVNSICVHCGVGASKK